MSGGDKRRQQRPQLQHLRPKVSVRLCWCVANERVCVCMCFVESILCCRATFFLSPPHLYSLPYSIHTVGASFFVVFMQRCTVCPLLLPLPAIPRCVRTRVVGRRTAPYCSRECQAVFVGLACVCVCVCVTYMCASVRVFIRTFCGRSLETVRGRTHIEFRVAAREPNGALRSAFLVFDSRTRDGRVKRCRGKCYSLLARSLGRCDRPCRRVISLYFLWDLAYDVAMSCALTIIRTVLLSLLCVYREEWERACDFFRICVSATFRTRRCIHSSRILTRTHPLQPVFWT